MEKWKHEFVQANGIKIHYVTAGRGPLVILLHGFPQSWYAWRHQIPALAEHYRVVVPDLRGYGETDRPLGVMDYAMSHLTQDIIGLIHALGEKKAHLVAHDWGGAIAWKIAIDHPEVIDHLVILNSPHPLLFAKALKSNFKQMARSWYFFFFQIPYVPEAVFNLAPEAILKNLFRGSTVRKETFSDQDLEHYTKELQKPGAFTAALNYYRAAFKKRSDQKKVKIAVPTLVIWGENDKALGKKLTADMKGLFEGTFLIEYIPNCSHWVQEEQPETVSKLVLQFLQNSHL